MKISQTFPTSQSSLRFPDLRSLNKNTQNLSISNQKQSRISYIEDPQKHDRIKKKLYNPRLSRRENELLWQQDPEQWLKLYKVNIHNIKQYVSQLYASESYKKASLFGFNISNVKAQLQKSNYQNKKTLYLLWTLFQTLNWQNISMKNLQDYIRNFSTQENQVQQVEVENGRIKLNKLDTTLQINLNTGEYILGPKKYELNRFLGQFYQRSITKITYESNTYQFKDKIKKVQSNDLLIAVSTQTQLFVISPIKQVKSFNIKTKDITVCKNKCYFARQNGVIGTIFLQTAYQPKLNELGLQDTIYNDILKGKQFFVSNNQHVFIVNINVDDELISIRKLQGKSNSFKFNIQPEQNQELVNKKAFIQGNYIHVLLFLGIGKDLTRIVEYKFYIVDA